MIALTCFRYILGLIFLVLGLIFFFIEIVSVFKLDYVLNRMHAAAIGDTLGISLSMIGLIIISGFNFTSCKFVLVLLFLWFSSPVSSHLISKLEVETKEENPVRYEELVTSQSEKEAVK